MPTAPSYRLAHTATGLVKGLISGGLLLFALSGCDQSPPDTNSTANSTANSAQHQSSERTGSNPDNGHTPGLSEGQAGQITIPPGNDLDALKARGQLRLVVPANVDGGRFLPRAGSPVDAQYEAAEAFAHSQGLQPVLIPVLDFKDLIPSLQDRGDLLIANLTVTEERRKHIAFSIPITHVHEQVLVRVEEESIKKLKDLNGKSIMADPASSFWPRLQDLKKKYPDMKLMPRPQGISDETELDWLSIGDIDAVIRDSNVAEMYLSYRNDLKIAFHLPGTRDIAWGLRKDAPKLQAALNHFLQLEHMDDPNDAIHKDDLAEIKKRRRLRVLLRNNAASYFLYRGELMGFEYEMARGFAKSLGLRLQVVVPPTHADMIDWLTEGRADMAAGFLEPLQSRKDKGAAFTRPYHYAPVHLVVRDKDAITGIDQLKGRTVVVRRSSSYWEILSNLQKAGYDFKLVPAPEDMETEELINLVAEGKIDLTASDGQILNVELSQGVAVRSAFTLGEHRPHAVAVRKENTKLLAALNKHIEQQYKGLTYNILYKKYFKNKRSIAKLARGRVDARADGSLSPYDPIVRKYAEEYGFDWRMLTAQMYQESRFDPKAESFAGARGLMQVMPRTAKSLGFKQLEKPEIGIHAGVKYMDWVRDRFDGNMPVAPRTWFTLAAYNVGAGHVQDARRLAQQLGLNPDLWFENTEKAMLLLSKKEYANKARHGYARGREPVNYVRNIRERFQAYVTLTEETLAANEINTDSRVLTH